MELGADGILYDECLHHSPTFVLLFDTSHGHRYGASSYGWDEDLIEGFREMVKDREFLIAGEAVYDFQHNYYDLSYARTGAGPQAGQPVHPSRRQYHDGGYRL